MLILAIVTKILNQFSPLTIRAGLYATKRLRSDFQFSNLSLGALPNRSSAWSAYDIHVVTDWDKAYNWQTLRVR